VNESFLAVRDYIPLRTTFEIPGGQLVLARPIIWDHPKGFSNPLPEQLFLVNPGCATLVHSLGSLRGRVRIRSTEQALEFVRLKTSPSTYHTFRTYARITDKAPMYFEEVDGIVMAEVLRRGEFETVSTFGLPDYLTGRRSNDPEGRLGIVSPETAQQAKLAATTVTVCGSDFRIERTIVEDTYLQTLNLANRYKLHRVVELVGSEGEYTLISKRSVENEALIGVRWDLASFRF
jgi:hypothetical protein